MITKTEIVELLKNNDKAIGRALVVLNERQTSDEQNYEMTTHANGRGFRPCHARMGTSMAKFYLRNNYLSEKQLSYWRSTQKDGKMRIEIYAGQLLDEAIAKANKQTEVKFENPYIGQDFGNLEEEKMNLIEFLSHADEYFDGELNAYELAERKKEISDKIDLIILAINQKWNNFK